MNNLAQAVTALQQGQVIAYPTEAVYGLGCDPDDEQAVMALLAIKQRPVEKGLILIADSITQLEPYVNFNALAPERISAILSSWPGPNTWVLPCTDKAPSWITGQFTTIAVRVTDHPVVKALCAQFGKPIVSTSANLAGEPAIIEFAKVQTDFAGQIALVVEGALGGRTQPSTIRDGVTGETYRL